MNPFEKASKDLDYFFWLALLCFVQALSKEDAIAYGVLFAVIYLGGVTTLGSFNYLRQRWKNRNAKNPTDTSS